MPRIRPTLALAAAAALAALAAAPAAHSDTHPSGFEAGVAAGEVGTRSATLWTRAPRAGTVRVEVARRGAGFREVARTTARVTHDLTVSVTVKGLRPATRYAYRFRSGSRRSATGHFRTAPSPRADATVRFAWSGDADAQPQTPGGPPFWNRFEVYDRMAAERNAFNVNLGDTIYSDTEVGATNANGQFVTGPPALTVADKWAKYRQNLARPPLRRLRASAALYSHWDDHEFINDFTQAENGAGLYRAGVAAFRDYAPVRWTHRDGLYRSFRWGRNLEVFFLDERSFRSAKASGSCLNPATGAPDLAPTAPAAARSVFAALVPSLAQPVAPACRAAIDDPGRTMLGARQYARFTTAIRRSTATFKVVMNEVPIQQFYALPYDRWEGYAAERAELLEFLQANVKDVIFLTTDVHANFVNDARLQTLEPGGPKDTGITDVTTGPVATKSFAKEIDDATGTPGSGALIAKLFFKPPPPAGVGMSCAAADVFSYGEVEVTAKRLTVRLKDASGRPVVDAGTGKPCAPVVLKR